MKKIFLLAALILLLMMGTFFYYIYFSPDALKGKRNIENLVKIKQGMDSVEVVNIMGTPFNIWQLDTERIFVYSTPPLYSEAIQIKLDSVGHVIEFGPIYPD